MSCYSYTTLACAFPADTPIANGSYFHVRYDDGQGIIEREAETGYCENILQTLNETFGRRVDEVPGLTLDLHYTTDEDGHWEFYIELEDGKWRYEESEIIFKQKPIEESYVNLDAGTPLARARRAWQALCRRAIDENGCIEGFLYSGETGLRKTYGPGSRREAICRDIEDETGISVDCLMGEAKNPAAPTKSDRQ